MCLMEKPPAQHDDTNDDAEPRPPFRVRTFSSEYGPEIDPDDPKSIKNLLDRLDIEHFLNVQRYGAGNP